MQFCPSVSYTIYRADKQNTSQPGCMQSINDKRFCSDTLPDAMIGCFGLRARYHWANVVKVTLARLETTTLNGNQRLLIMKCIHGNIIC